MPLTGNIDTKTVAQLAADLGGLTPPELTATLEDIKRRFGFTFTPYIETSVSSGVTAPPVIRGEWFSLVRRGLAFGGADNSPAVAAQSSFIQLRNPNANQRVLVYQAAQTTAANAGGLWVLGAQAALGAASASLTNLLSSGPAPAAQLRLGSQVGAPAGVNIQRVDFQGSQLSWRIGDVGSGFVCELLSGDGLTQILTTANTAMNGMFLWAEVPTTYL